MSYLKNFWSKKKLAGVILSCFLLVVAVTIASFYPFSIGEVMSVFDKLVMVIIFSTLIVIMFVILVMPILLRPTRVNIKK